MPPSSDGPILGRRASLARWLTRPDNPLVARVFVNRVWQQHFGRGLVATPNDFGSEGDEPTHPELLDWLATDFVDGGWRVKRLHRQIMLSATYQLSSRTGPAAGFRIAQKAASLATRALPSVRSSESNGQKRRRLGLAGGEQPNRPLSALALAPGHGG